MPRGSLRKYVISLAMSLVYVFVLSLGGCAPKVAFFKDGSDPLREFTLSGSAAQKILLVPVRGFISARPKQGVFSTQPGMVQDVAAILQKAEDDDDIKALVIQVDSPGGEVVATEMLYHELMRYRERTGAKAVALMMSVAASGGYHASLAADVIVAHPSTITGSVGTIFIRPNIKGLMDKIGVSAEVTKSGSNKDMGSPFRDETASERALMQGIIDDMNGRFLEVVGQRRGLDEQALTEVADARVYTANQAVEAGLVDRIGHAEDALAQARLLAGLPEDARVVVYRRTQYGDDTLYNTATGSWSGGHGELVKLELSHLLPVQEAGFYHLWAPQLMGAGE